MEIKINKPFKTAFLIGLGIAAAEYVDDTIRFLNSVLSKKLEETVKMNLKSEDEVIRKTAEFEAKFIFPESLNNKKVKQKIGF